MKKVCIIILLFFPVASAVSGQENTAVSMYLKKDRETALEYIKSTSGNLFNKLGHHGPAIENQWYALRLYFSKKAAIDVYSKARPGLELPEKGWYPSKAEQLEGWGADYYKVGRTVGLGGIRLWDGEQVQDLNPVLLRSARVSSFGDSCSMEMISKGVPYEGGKVDIMVRVSMYSSRREAKVEAFSLTGEAVRFVTGINYFADLETGKGDNYVLTWGIHPEDVAAEKVEVGAALVFPMELMEMQMDDGRQFLYVTRPLQSFSTWITSSCAREAGMASFGDFEKQVKKLIQKL